MSEEKKAEKKNKTKCCYTCAYSTYIGDGEVYCILSNVNYNIMFYCGNYKPSDRDMMDSNIRILG